MITFTLTIKDVTITLEADTNNLKNTFRIYEAFTTTVSSNEVFGTYCTI